ncbi:MAG: dihydroorotate dehydrogenase-like protein [Bacteroidales bacterium]
MTDLSCTYLGLKLRNPLVAGSSGLTSSIENLKNIAAAGAGAVVLKSIFEEQIRYESEKLIESDHPVIKPWKSAFEGIVSSKEFYFEEAFNYLTSYARDHTLSSYLKLISDAKKAIDIPVIASINCRSNEDWQYFAKKIQEAGADALELNIYVLPSDPAVKPGDNEKVYFDIIKEVLKYVTIPVSVKTGYYFSSLSYTLGLLSESGISGLTMFNRPYNPDIDIDTMHLSSSNMLSTEHEYQNTLRWVALLSGHLKCDIAASSGIHDWQTVVKQLLAGADVVQAVSLFYRHGFGVIPELLHGIEKWMGVHGYKSINDFKGLLSSRNINNPAAYERVQFIRLYTGIE